MNYNENTQNHRSAPHEFGVWFGDFFAKNVCFRVELIRMNRIEFIRSSKNNVFISFANFGENFFSIWYKFNLLNWNSKISIDQKTWDISQKKTIWDFRTSAVYIVFPNIYCVFSLLLSGLMDRCFFFSQNSLNRMITHLHQKFISFVQCRMAHLIEIQQLFLQCNLNRIKSLWKRKKHFGAHLHQSSSFVQRFFFFAFNIRLGSSFFVPIPACSCISFCPFFFFIFSWLLWSNEVHQVHTGNCMSDMQEENSLNVI